MSSVVGPGRARVQLSAEFDFNRITETSDKFDPEGRVVRSSQTREESSATRQPGRPGHGRQRAARRRNSGQQSAGQPGQPRDQSKKSEEIVNYEISRTTKTEVIEGGRVKRISVAVLVDGSYAKNDKGEVVYQPRTKEELDRIAALVRTAIGFDQKRGDQIEVVNLRFAEAPAAPIAEPQPASCRSCSSPRTTSCAAIELVVMALLGLVVVLFVVRPLVRRILAPEEPRALAAAAPAPPRWQRGAAARGAFPTQP